MITGGGLCPFQRLTGYLVGRFVVSGAMREAVMLGYPRTEPSPSQVEAEITRLNQQRKNAPPAERDVLNRLIDRELEKLTAIRG